MDNIASSDKEKSKTLPNKFLLNGNIKLSNSFTASSTFGSSHASTFDDEGNKIDSSLYSISSKSKPIAPKLSATIGVASGAEALKTINTFNLNKTSTDIDSSSSSSISSVKNNTIATKLHHSQRASDYHDQEERRPSITRIIRSDSFQNVKPIAPVAQRPTSNSIVSSSSHSSIR